MKLDYQIHSIARGEGEVTAKVGGKDRTLRQDLLIVELVREGSALTLRLDDVEEAEKLFSKRGKTITLTLGAK